MQFQVNVRQLLRSLGLHARVLLELVVDLLLRLHEVLIVANDLDCHQVVRDDLLRLDRVEVLLVGDE